MLAPRFFPCLTVLGERLVKTERFANPRYVGDPLNAARIFNTKEVDELLLIDIGASREGRPPPVALVRRFVAECSMPLAAGGGVRSLEHAAELLAAGAEKVALQSAALERPALVGEIASRFGSQSVVVALDARRVGSGGHEVWGAGGTHASGENPATAARRMEEAGAGEILVTSIDRDGSREGYDLELVRAVVNAVRIPVIACGGAGTVAHLIAAVREGGASAATGGSLFVFHGRRQAVLIGFPPRSELEAALAGSPGSAAMHR